MAIKTQTWPNLLFFLNSVKIDLIRIRLENTQSAGGFRTTISKYCKWCSWKQRRARYRGGWSGIQQYSKFWGEHHIRICFILCASFLLKACASLCLPVCLILDFRFILHESVISPGADQHLFYLYFDYVCVIYFEKVSERPSLIYKLTMLR